MSKGRHSVHEAIILRTRPLGEIHAWVSLLTRERGLIDVIGNGLRSEKSKLRSACQLYNTVRVWLAKDGKTPFERISDLEVLHDCPGMRTRLASIYHAAFANELLVISHVAEDSTWAFDLLWQHLRYLDQCALSDEACARATLAFLWKYLQYNGMQDELSQSAVLFGVNSLSALSGGSLGYLRYTRDLPYEEAVRVGIETASMRQTFWYMHAVVRQLTDHPLKTLDATTLPCFFGSSTNA